MKPLIIGEAPSKNEVLPRPISGRVGKRLASLCGLTLEEFLQHFDRVNLLHVRQDTKEKGFEFDVKAARIEAGRIMSTLVRDQVVLLLGRRVANAFGFQKHAYFEQLFFIGRSNMCINPGMGPDVRVMPHPSGVNRWYNEPANWKQAEEFMRRIVERTR